MLVQSFTVSKLDNHLCTQYRLFICSFEYCHLFELYAKCAALYWAFIPQSLIMGNNSNGPVAGHVRGMVVGQRTAQTENSVRHTKSCRIRGMVVDECGRSTGVLLRIDYYAFYIFLVIVF